MQNAWGLVWAVLAAGFFLRTGFKLARATDTIGLFQVGAGVGFVSFCVLTALSHLVRERGIGQRISVVSLGYFSLVVVVYLITRGEPRPELFLFVMPGGFFVAATIWSAATLIRKR